MRNIKEYIIFFSLYENGGKMSNLMSTKEVLEGLIDDLEDSIDDYNDTIAHAGSKLVSYEYTIRCSELKRWKRSLKELIEELED